MDAKKVAMLALIILKDLGIDKLIDEMNDESLVALSTLVLVAGLSDDDFSLISTLME